MSCCNGWDCEACRSARRCRVLDSRRHTTIIKGRFCAAMGSFLCRVGCIAERAGFWRSAIWSPAPVSGLGIRIESRTAASTRVASSLLRTLRPATTPPKTRGWKMRATPSALAQSTKTTARSAASWPRALCPPSPPRRRLSVKLWSKHGPSRPFAPRYGSPPADPHGPLRRSLDRSLVTYAPQRSLSVSALTASGWKA